MNQLSPSLMNRCSIKEVEFGPITEAPTKCRNAKVLLLGASDSGKSTVVKQVSNFKGTILNYVTHMCPYFLTPSLPSTK